VAVVLCEAPIRSAGPANPEGVGGCEWSAKLDIYEAIPRQAPAVSGRNLGAVSGYRLLMKELGVANQL
jgi:hypothetical protein